MPHDDTCTDKRIQVAKIAQSHGVRGLVKLLITASDPSILNEATLYTGETSVKTIKIKLKNSMGKYWLAEVDGVTDKNMSDTLRHTELWVDRSALPDTDDGEFYYDDLIGLDVLDLDRNNESIGHIIAVNNFGASDLLDIKPKTGESFFLPFTDETVPEIDLDGGFIKVSIPAGLLNHKEQDDGKD